MSMGKDGGASRRESVADLGLLFCPTLSPSDGILRTFQLQSVSKDILLVFKIFRGKTHSRDTFFKM